MKNKVLHAKIRDIVQPGMLFLNIGANDGVYHDPFYDYVTEQQWQGYAIEPTQTAFSSLEKNFAHNKNVKCINAAIISNAMRNQSQESRVFWRYSDIAIAVEPGLTMLSSYRRNNLEEYSKLVHITEEFTSFRNNYPDIAFNLDKHIVQTSVPSEYTLQEFIDTEKITHIDAINIDVEKLDYDIFKSFDFNKYLPSIFIIETVHFTEAEHADFKNTMLSHGYIFRLKYKLFSDVYVIPHG